MMSRSRHPSAHDHERRDRSQSGTDARCASALVRLSMQRLYLQFYVTILVVLAVFVGAAALLWWLADDDGRRRNISTSPPS